MSPEDGGTAKLGSRETGLPWGKAQKWSGWPLSPPPAVSPCLAPGPLLSSGIHYLIHAGQPVQVLELTGDRRLLMGRGGGAKSVWGLPSSRENLSILHHPHQPHPSPAKSHGTVICPLSLLSHTQLCPLYPGQVCSLPPPALAPHISQIPSLGYTHHLYSPRVGNRPLARGPWHPDQGLQYGRAMIVHGRLDPHLAADRGG